MGQLQGQLPAQEPEVFRRRPGPASPPALHRDEVQVERAGRIPAGPAVPAQRQLEAQQRKLLALARGPQAYVREGERSDEPRKAAAGDDEKDVDAVIAGWQDWALIGPGSPTVSLDLILARLDVAGLAPETRS